jgi:hypothetical protein
MTRRTGRGKGKRAEMTDGARGVGSRNHQETRGTNMEWSFGVGKRRPKVVTRMTLQKGQSCPRVSSSPGAHLQMSAVPQSKVCCVVGRARWSRLRSLIPQIVPQEQSTPTQDRSAVVSNQINITDELTSGGLAAIILRLWFERDEKGHRRIPVLLHRLRIRVSDSLHPMHGSKAVFRIECQYANGAARWVVYKTLRDFFSLHTHYTVSNLQNRNKDKLPEFPRTSTSSFAQCRETHPSHV